MAQSASALVAIIGAALVNRVLPLDSERQELERRVRELEQQTSDQTERLREARRRRGNDSWRRYVDVEAAKCATRYETHGSVSPEWLVDRFWLRRVPTREMLGMAGRLVEETRQASENFERCEGMPDIGTTDWTVYQITKR